MKLALNEIDLVDFKGVAAYRATLSNAVVFAGTNRTGKTTIANAINWCLFGKDIYNRSNYEIMPVDIVGNMIPHKKPSVTLVFDIDGSKKKLQRVMEQKWVKKRGEAESSFDGSCTTSYFVDDVPVKAKEYNEIVNQIIAEDLFRVITLPTYFPSLDWKKKREMITAIVGDVDIEGIQAREEFAKLVAHMDGKDLADYRKMIAFQKKDLKKRIDAIPASIAAAKKFIPETEPNYVNVAEFIKGKKAEIAAIDVQISDKSKVLDTYQETLKGKQAKIQELESFKTKFISDFVADKQKELDTIANNQNQHNSDVSELTRKIEEKEQFVRTKNATLNSLTVQFNDLQKSIDEGRKKWISTNNSVFVTPEDDKCMSCGQTIVKTDEEKAEMESTFNNTKANSLTDIVASNKPLIAECDSITNKKGVLVDDIEKLNLEITPLKKQLSDLQAISFTSQIAAVNISAARIKATEQADYIAFDTQINAIKNESSEAPKIDVTEFNTQKANLTAEIEVYQKQINAKDSIDQARANITEYEKEGKEKADQLAELESYEFSTELMEKAIAEDVENRINSRLLGGVTFKMFNKQNKRRYQTDLRNPY